MYERKIPEDLDCGITVAMKVFGGKWKPCIIDAINKGYHRPSEMHRQIPATPRVIDMQLRELDDCGVVFKVVNQGFPLRAHYYLTELGKSILPVIENIDRWGALNRHDVKKALLKSA